MILSTTLYPAAVNINNSAKIFGLGGAGSIAGIGALTKSGTALVVISSDAVNAIRWLGVSFMCTP